MERTALRERLTTIYGDSEEVIRTQLARYSGLRDAFNRRYGSAPAATIVRAPGRVNLIGEHTDYNGYPVLPMAIDRDILMAFVPVSSPRVTVENLDARFPPLAFDASVEIPRDPQGSWGNYVKAAVQGILSSGLVAPERANGMTALCSGSVPLSAGLSSSSALVVATGLAILGANGGSCAPLKLAEILVRAERYAGMEGGGMDQTISMMGSVGHALKIDFFPLSVSQAALPPGYVFVVCNSLVAAPKAASARDAYNTRVVECRLSAALVAHHLTVDLKQVQRLADVSPASLRMPVDQVAETAREVLHEAPWTLDEIARHLGVSREFIVHRYCTTGTGSVVEEPPDGYRLLQRYRHVVSEAGRVERAAMVMQSDPFLFGTLMNDSHASCRDDYEISCPELEDLVSVARENGAIGARLTGAGFGGCTVNMVEEHHVQTFTEGIRRGYYTGIPSPVEFGDVVFPCRAVEGAGTVVRQ
jgi:N-acetylgalactosamine kinase